MAGRNFVPIKEQYVFCGAQASFQHWPPLIAEILLAIHLSSSNHNMQDTRTPKFYICCFPVESGGTVVVGSSILSVMKGWAYTYPSPSFVGQKALAQSNRIWYARDRESTCEATYEIGMNKHTI